MTNSQILMAALAYSQCGNWQEVANSFAGLTSDRVRLAVRRAAETNEALRNAIDDGLQLSAKRARQARRMGLLEPKKYLVRNDLALKRHHDIHEMRAATPSPVTLGQKLMGEPLPGRSALDKINAEKRRKASETSPNFVGRVWGDNHNRSNVVTLPNVQIGQGS